MTKRSFWESTETGRGLADIASPLHSGAQSAAYHAARFQACQLDWDAAAAYDMGGELAPAGLSDEELAAASLAELFGG